MKKTAVIYWSGTGNTEAMANAVAEGMREAGAECAVWTPADVGADAVKELDAAALGCPAMGAEELEETEFAPMFDAVKSALAGKPVGLFGSYGWGDGEWMRTWEEDCGTAGINRVADSVICCEAPDDEELEETEFAPMFDAVKSALAGKPVGLFGSYGWGDGEWMRTWEEDCGTAGINRVADSVICCEAPDDEALAACRALGRKLAE